MIIVGGGDLDAPLHWAGRPVAVPYRETTYHTCHSEGATRPPPVADKGRGASGSGRQGASLLCQAQQPPGTTTEPNVGIS